MNIVESLKKYNSIKATITIVEAEIQEIENEVYSISASQTDGQPKGKGFPSSSIETYLIAKENELYKKMNYVEKLKNEIKIIENLVKTLKKYNQDIIEMRFYNMMSIEEIATKKDRTYTSIQKTINKSLKILTKEFEKNQKSY